MSAPTSREANSYRLTPLHAVRFHFSFFFILNYVQSKWNDTDPNERTKLHRKYNNNSKTQIFIIHLWKGEENEQTLNKTKMEVSLLLDETIISEKI